MSLIELNLFTNSTRSTPIEVIKRTYDSFTDVFGKIPVRVYMDINPNVSRAEKYSDQLQKQFKDVILLKMEGFSGKEISEELNIANGTVKSRLSRARNILNEKFKI
jgi:DNA-binding NarL/FixJ family response regulator